MLNSTRNTLFFTGMLSLLATATVMADVKNSANGRTASQTAICQDVQLMSKLIMELRQDGQTQESTQATIDRAFNQETQWDITSRRIYTRINEQAYATPIAPTAAGKQQAVTDFQLAARQSCLNVSPGP